MESTRKLNSSYCGYDFTALRTVIFNIYNDLNNLNHYRDYFTGIELYELDKDLKLAGRIMDYINKEYPASKITNFKMDFSLWPNEQDMIYQLFVLEEKYRAKVGMIWNQLLHNYKMRGKKVLLGMLKRNDINTLKKHRNYIVTHYVDIDKKHTLNVDSSNIGLLYMPDGSNYLGACALSGRIFTENDVVFDENAKSEDIEFLRIFDCENPVYAGYTGNEHEDIFTKIKTPIKLNSDLNPCNDVIIKGRTYPEGVVCYLDNEEEDESYEQALAISDDYGVPLIKVNKGLVK